MTPTSDSPTPRRRVARLAVGAAAAALTCAGTAAVLPGTAQAAPPQLVVAGATCDAGQWHVQWQFDNSSAGALTITAENVTGAASGALNLVPNPVPASADATSTFSFPATTTGTITGHVTYHPTGGPDVTVGGTWDIGETEAGTIPVTNHCAPSAVLAVSPSSALPGTGVQITGHCEANTSGVAYSNVFVDIPPDRDFGGLGAVAFTTDASGAFSVWATIDPRSVPGTYTVSARCGGANIGVNADLIILTPAVTPKLDDPAPAATTDTPVKAVPAFTG